MTNQTGASAARKQSLVSILALGALAVAASTAAAAPQQRQRDGGVAAHPPLLNPQARRPWGTTPASS